MNYSLTRLWKIQSEAKKQKALDSFDEHGKEGSR